MNLLTNLSHRCIRPLVPILLAALALAAAPAPAAEVNVYSARKEALIKPLLDRFTAQTGIRVNLVTGKADALLQRLKSEGVNSPADILLTVDAGRLHRAKQAGVLQPLRPGALDGLVPAAYRDPDGYWYGLSLRARTIVYAKDRVRPGRLSTYAALAGREWQGRICVRSSNNIYNQSLVAAMIAHDGVEAAEDWARKLVRNMARPPRGGDRDQIKAVAAGQCDIAIANTYYFGKMLHSKKAAEREAAGKVAIFWPDQHGRGVHVNVSGAGLTRSAPHRDDAIRLLRFLLTDDAQAWYANANFEYPVRPGIPVSETLKAWGDFKADSLGLAALGEHNAEAVRVMDRAGWK